MKCGPANEEPGRFHISPLYKWSDDHLQFVEHCLVFLNGYPEEKQFSCEQHGAMHQARLMPMAIYSIKITQLQDQNLLQYWQMYAVIF